MENKSGRIGELGQIEDDKQKEQRTRRNGKVQEREK